MVCYECPTSLPLINSPMLLPNLLLVLSLTHSRPRLDLLHGRPSCRDMIRIYNQVEKLIYSRHQYPKNVTDQTALAPNDRATEWCFLVDLNTLQIHKLFGNGRNPHLCGILPKNCRMAPSPLRHVASLIPPGRGILTHSTRTSHIRIRSTFRLLRISHIRIRPTFYLIRMSHSRNYVRLTSHFSPDISQPQFYPADVPPSPDVSHIRIRPTFYLIRMSHSRNSVRPTSHFLRISHSRNSIRPTFHLLRIFHIRLLTPDGKGGRLNFPGQTCPDPSVTFRRTSVANDSDSPDSLARQILAIRWIHFHPQ
uniref:Uncharacterized protein n=1 Tax=Vitis vinifera TaxID=29760 RepID=A5AHY3_VITVI|nr:hypothetical protein VITISV_000083 [Vitis vinifera]